MNRVGQLRWILIVIAAAVMAACANMGRPEGGPRDELPPVYVRSNPALGQLNVSSGRITVEFDENIQLDDAMNKIVVSPAQYTTPSISSNGRKVHIELRDTLVPNTTYTIDFADAVKDLNEGNILDGLAIDFSTGPTIDSLRISGMVLEARTLEPAQGILVGAYSSLTDTTLTTLPFERITKTNQLGQFTLRNLKEGTYYIFAIDDVNRDYHWDRSENIAFYGQPVTPTTEPATVTDTLVRADGTRDSLVTRSVTRFLPDDLLLTWFNEGYAAQYLKDYKRPERNKITFQFATKADTLPILTLINTHRKGDEISSWAKLIASPTLDTLTYWITDTTLSLLDSISLEARYLRTDTSDCLTWTTDTLKFNLRPSKEKKDDEKKKKKNKKDDDSDTIPEPVPHLKLNLKSGTSQELNKGLLLSTDIPIGSFNPKGVRLEIQVDTLWYNMERPVFTPASDLNSLLYSAPYTWEEGTRYRLTVDSAAVCDIYGMDNDVFTQEFTTKKSDDYSTITFNISSLDDRPAIVEILNSSDQPVASAPVIGSSVTVKYLNPGSYYARLYIDSDSDRMWTTGSVNDTIQPEETYYYPKKINLKKNWTVEQSWDIDELPVDMQKPSEIKKNKPKRKKGERDTGRRTDEDDEDEYDEFNSNPFLNNHSSSNRYGNNSNYYNNY